MCITNQHAECTAFPEQKDTAMHKEMSEKILKALDVDHDGSLDSSQMMYLVEAFFKVAPQDEGDDEAVWRKQIWHERTDGRSPYENA